jgi:hypothetical protein
MAAVSKLNWVCLAGQVFVCSAETGGRCIPLDLTDINDTLSNGIGSSETYNTDDHDGTANVASVAAVTTTSSTGQRLPVMVECGYNSTVILTTGWYFQ